MIAEDLSLKESRVRPLAVTLDGIHMHPLWAQQLDVCPALAGATLLGMVVGPVSRVRLGLVHCKYTVANTNPE